MSLATRRLERRADKVRHDLERWMFRHRAAFAVATAFAAACAIGFAAVSGLTP